MSASIPSWARVGARVVCVNAKPAWNSASGRPSKYSVLPVEGQAYTIQEVVWHVWPSSEGVGLRLREITRKGGNAPFVISRFRPAVEDSDEIGIETQLYRAKGRKSKAPARDRADA